MQWTSDYIKIWFWPRGSIPEDIQAGGPTPDNWGLPTSNWAGNTWEDSCVAKTSVSSCAAYVGDNPSAFVEM
jgi:hypothetical protein